jgi:hypothetical protein
VSHSACHGSGIQQPIFQFSGRESDRVSSVAEKAPKTWQALVHDAGAHS